MLKDKVKPVCIRFILSLVLGSICLFLIYIGGVLIGIFTTESIPIMSIIFLVFQLGWFLGSAAILWTQEKGTGSSIKAQKRLSSSFLIMAKYAEL